MARVLFWLLLLIAAWLILQRVIKRGERKRDGHNADKQTQASPPTESMVKCINCGVYIPCSESMMKGERITCREPATCQHHQTTDH